MKKIFIFIVLIFIAHISIVAQCDELALENKRLSAKIVELETSNDNLAKKLVNIEKEVTDPNKIGLITSNSEKTINAGYNIQVGTWHFSEGSNIQEGHLDIKQDEILLNPEDLKKLSQKELSNLGKEIDRLSKQDLPVEEFKKRLQLELIHILEVKPEPSINQFPDYNKKVSLLVINRSEEESCSEINNRIMLYLENNPELEAHVILKNINNADEVIAIKNSIKIGTTKLSVLKELNLKNIMTHEYDFEKATINEFQKSENGLSNLMLTLPKIKNSTPEKARVLLREIPRRFYNQIKEIIISLLGRAKNEKFDFVNEFRRQLELQGIDYNKIEIQLEDCIICQKGAINENTFFYECYIENNQTRELSFGDCSAGN